jgi:hypothetical protein
MLDATSHQLDVNVGSIGLRNAFDRAHTIDMPPNLRCAASSAFREAITGSGNQFANYMRR